MEFANEYSNGVDYDVIVVNYKDGGDDDKEIDYFTKIEKRINEYDKNKIFTIQGEGEESLIDPFSSNNLDNFDLTENSKLNAIGAEEIDIKLEDIPSEDIPSEDIPSEDIPSEESTSEESNSEKSEIDIVDVEDLEKADILGEGEYVNNNVSTPAIKTDDSAAIDPFFTDEIADKINNLLAKIQ